MGKNDTQNQLAAAKRAYKSAKAEGNRSEEAKWANVIGDILKNRGEYIEALRWLRIDYEISLKYLSEKQLLPSCQSLGEVYLRIQDYKHALTFQKKHLELAKDENDLVEQQRASTQLGRTYHEIFLKSEDDHDSVRNARKYFKLALALAKTLKKNLRSSKHSFVKEYIDAYNNIGMLEVDLDNLEEAEKVLREGLEICDEEEVNEDDDGRSRLHHNLGNVYTELRKWNKAREHIEKDILICHRIGHCQGEAKGYINLGELHYRVQKYDEAMKCYEWALKLAKSMEDEDALISQANQNIEIVKEACRVMDEIKKEEQNLKKLAREMEIARGTEGERKCLLQQNSSLDRLIEKSSAIFAWLKHHTYAKKKKQIASELCDKEKLSDSFLAIGESYQKFREFDKALKWYNKSLDTYRAIGNLEGQALAKINIGNILDSNGNWGGALVAFEEGYRIATQAKKPSIQLSALENMHYSQMIRFDNVEEARRLQSSIDKLKKSKVGDLEAQYVAGDCCSESETEVGSQSPITSYDSILPKTAKLGFKISKSHGSEDELNEDMPLISLVRPKRNLAKLKSAHVETTIVSTELPNSSSPSMLRPAGSQAVGRKRVRLVLSDDEGDNEDVYSSSRIISTPLEGEMGDCSRRTSHKCSVENVATSDQFKDTNYRCSPSHGLKDVSPVGSRCVVGAFTPVSLEESTCSDKSRTPELGSRDDKDFTYSSTKNSAPKFSFGGCGRKLDADVSGNDIISDLTLHACSEHCQHILFRIGNNVVHVKWGSGNAGMLLNLEQMKVEVACLYYLQLPAEERSKGLVPVIQHMMHDGRVIESLEAVSIFNDNMAGKACIDVSIDVWVPKHLMKLYIDCCEELSQPPILKVIKMLYNQEVSEDEIVVSDCELQDISVAPLINALYVHKTFAVLDLSHNLLGNGTMEKLKRVFTSSGQNYGGLTLDLHCNRLGSTALFQICECHVLYARLEVLNISGNRLTDACASYLSTILQNCKALYSLNIEKCSITSRTIQKVADSLTSGSALTHLSLGHNHPIAANAVINLLATLTNLKSFQELSLKGIKLSRPVIESLCQLVKSSSLSGLLLGSTSIGPDGMLKLMQSLSIESQELKLDVSFCDLTPDCIVKLNAEVSVFNRIVELDLGGNQLKQEGGRALAAALSNSRCCLRVLLLQKCQLGLLGILWILKGLSENYYLEELNLAENADREELHALPHDPCSLNKCSNVFQTDANLLDHMAEAPAANDNEGCQEELCTINTDDNLLEAPDSEDEQVEVDAIERATNRSSNGASLKNHSDIESEFIQELSAAIQMAKYLQLLDLSNNGFTKELAESLYAAWASSSRSGSSQGHIEDNTIHLSVEGLKCCHLKTCCRRI
ncbi:protein TONSOKU isoform X2 [Nicotiana tabacum]|uniref:Protein TONSOKU n=1 Tax=Nicotiana tabacum TaxID=4097 RepID=A0A1S4CGQ5_TOBAC|nr:PREDICTED: protein TONSOKU-like isoform X2 [Nicotiana tabacum]